MKLIVLTSLLSIALIIHTIAEVWIPAYQKVRPDWRAVVFDRLLFYETLGRGNS